MKPQPKKTILKVNAYLPGKPIEEVQRELGLKSVVKLASNENPYPPAPSVLRAINKAALNVNRYPASDCFYLKQALAKKLKVRPSQLVFGNGSDELIVLTVRSFVGEGDEVVMAKPSFLIYSIASRLIGAQVKEIPLKDLRYDLEAMKKAITKKTKVVFLGNPDNPCGKYLRKKEVCEFLKGVRKDIIVFFDEAYYEYVNEKDYVDSLALMKTNKNVILTRTFSKMYGLAGLRVGYGVADESVVEVFDRLREPFNVNSVAQAAALACLKEKTYYQNVARDVKRQRKFLYESLESLGIEPIKTYSNFILIKVDPRLGNITRALMKKGVIVRDMEVWGLKNMIRVSIGTEKENKKFIQALKQINR